MCLMVSWVHHTRAMAKECPVTLVGHSLATVSGVGTGTGRYQAMLLFNPLSPVFTLFPIGITLHLEVLSSTVRRQRVKPLKQIIT